MEPLQAGQARLVTVLPMLGEVSILRDGTRRFIVPADASWDDFFGAPGIDLPDREQPRAEERERS